MSFEGLRDMDRPTEMQRAVIDQHMPCHCLYGIEPCCEFEVHEAEDLLEYFEAPQAVHPYHKAHYCLVGDEPECDYLRKQEQESQDKRRKQMQAESQPKQQPQQR